MGGDLGLPSEERAEQMKRENTDIEDKNLGKKETNKIRNHPDFPSSASAVCVLSARTLPWYQFLA
jgi:hypothetical protein